MRIAGRGLHELIIFHGNRPLGEATPRWTTARFHIFFQLRFTPQDMVIVLGETMSFITNILQ